MARTRSKGTAKAAKAADSADNTTTTSAPSSSKTIYALPAEIEKPPQLFVLPEKATSKARIVTLQHPRYARPTRYFVCPEAGFFEFTKIASPKTVPRSWLLAPQHSTDSSTKAGFNAQVTKAADLYVASPVDPLFLLLPALIGADPKKKRMFLSSDDHFDSLRDSSEHFSEIIRLPEIRRLLEARMAAFCDTVDAGDEQMYRLNEDKLAKEILSKAQRMSEGLLPKSMEEKFITKALEAPILGVRSQQSMTTSTSTPVEDGASTPSLESAESQSTVSSVETSATSVSEASTAATAMTEESVGEVVTNAMTASEEVVKLQRLRVACNFICSSYVAPGTAELLKKRIAASKEMADFTALDEYLTQLAKLRADAAAARSSDYSRKHTLDEEEDERAEKRRKKEEEEKTKKGNQSRGVRELKKVNTAGMKKLSEFFKKK
ncbi:ribonuclease H2, subunit B [Diplogelasinospora grovesii]|uniref:Ribonuclease H2 subunit B n=1 Tax=Diplogelasinospora grovesii TaxID=303347 RepID=A0AAN6NGW9_9PEZI|nr:ribonuclease H2, subunit B [Diplogelasinospora grovesii]